MSLYASWMILVVMGLFLILPVMIGVYVYRDSESRGMNAPLWTLIAVLGPAFVGLIIYLIVRSESGSLKCPQCRNPVTDKYTLCPNCGASLKHRCRGCGNPLEPSWNQCPSCGLTVPEDQRSPVVDRAADRGLGKILIAVILIPLLIMGLLIGGLFTFRSSISSSIGSVDGMRVEDYADLPVVSGWLKECDQLGDGIYVLEYEYPREGDWAKVSYLIYRKGLTGMTNVSVGSSSLGIFKGPALDVTYNDSDAPSELDYHLYQVDYSADKVPRLVIQINGQEAPYRQTMTIEPLAFAEASMWRHEASNLYEARTPYLGDASAVVNLIDRTGLPRFGPYTIELQTKEEPFGLRISFESSLKTFGRQDRAHAIILLGLIDNLSYVEVVGSDDTQRITREEASEELGYDVKELGQSPGKLAEYLKGLY